MADLSSSSAPSFNSRLSNQPGIGPASAATSIAPAAAAGSLEWGCAVPVSALARGGRPTRNSAGCVSMSGAAAGPVVCIDKTAGNATVRTAMMTRRGRWTPKTRCPSKPNSGESNYRGPQNGDSHRKYNKNYAYRLPVASPQVPISRRPPSLHRGVDRLAFPRAFPARQGKIGKKSHPAAEAILPVARKDISIKYLPIRSSSFRPRLGRENLSLLCAQAGKWQGSANKSPSSA